MRPITPQRQIVYDVTIVLSIVAAAIITYVSLTAGIYEVFPYFYLIPIILIAFARPRLSIYGTVLVGWMYLALVFIIGLPTIRLYMLATVWFYIFVSLGVLISTYSQVYHKEGERSCGTYYNSQAGAFRFDKETLNIVDANYKFASILHFECRDIITRNLKDFLPDKAALDEFLKQVRDKRRVRDIEVGLVAYDGAIHWALVSAADCDDATIICTVVDITENKQAQEALTAANKKLTLLNNITRHDILNQLTALIGFLEISRNDTRDPELLKYIAKEEAAANAIKSQILFTRDYQDVGGQSPKWQNVAETVSLAIATLDLRRVEVSFDLPQVQVFADPLLEKVFYNLVENSLRHGEKVTKISLRAEETPDGINILIEDDGVGVPAAAKEKIFRREYFKNTGFGLFLTREILSITGLSISETGTPGSGARFVIHAPKGMYRTGSAVTPAIPATIPREKP
ncbi:MULTISPECIES: sensor histidine kinase [unclassified Methanoregula]|uniref:sensor histidine kinase n=1 Tax=unclassified Methanoregula TaxID=2649730 RepID=UPI0025EA6468|nr:MULTISPECIES: ATP-binding protein [unclassified Methanoregula]